MATRLRALAVLACSAALVLPAAAFAAGPAPLAAQACVGCHGQAGAGSGNTPAIAGKDRADFVATLRAFRADQRPATIMNRIARGFTDEEYAALAEYYAAAAPPARRSRQAPQQQQRR